MVFDIICAITVLGLALKGIKEVFFNRLALIVAFDNSFYFFFCAYAYLCEICEASNKSFL